MELTKPDAAYEESFLSAMAEFQAEGRNKDFNAAAAGADFGAYVERVRQQAAGKYLPSGYVPSTVYWLIDRGEFIGSVSIRHHLNDELRAIGGHIGYAIRPSKRGKGYGSAILRLALPKARELGISQALLTCDETNVASRKIIEKNGGVLEDKIPNPAGGPDKLRFWIDLS